METQNTVTYLFYLYKLYSQPNMERFSKEKKNLKYLYRELNELNSTLNYARPNSKKNCQNKINQYLNSHLKNFEEKAWMIYYANTIFSMQAKPNPMVTIHLENILHSKKYSPDYCRLFRSVISSLRTDGTIKFCPKGEISPDDPNLTPINTIRLYPIPDTSSEESKEQDLLKTVIEWNYAPPIPANFKIEYSLSEISICLLNPWIKATYKERSKTTITVTKICNKFDDAITFFLENSYKYISKKFSDFSLLKLSDCSLKSLIQTWYISYTDIVLLSAHEEILERLKKEKFSTPLHTYIEAFINNVYDKIYPTYFTWPYPVYRIEIATKYKHYCFDVISLIKKTSAESELNQEQMLDIIFDSNKFFSQDLNDVLDNCEKTYTKLCNEYNDKTLLELTDKLNKCNELSYSFSKQCFLNNNNN